MNVKPFCHPAFRGRFGVARREITPPVGIHSKNWGAATHDTAEGVHRPFLMTVLTIQADEETQPFALVALDLGWWRGRGELEVLSAGISRAGIADGHFLIALSHTHAGPIFCPELVDKPGGEFIEPYLASLAENLRGAVEEALANTFEGVWETASGRCGLAANRDLPDPQGNRLLVGWNPDEIADDTVLFGRVSDASGTLRATLVNYACHPTILAWENRRLSPDYIGAMREVVESETQAPCLFLQGASGELAPREQYVGDPAVADRAGRALGHAVLGIYFGMLSPGHELVFSGAVESGASLAMWKSQPRVAFPADIASIDTELELPMRDDLPTPAVLRAEIEGCEDRVVLERLQRALVRREMLGNGGTLTCRHHLWRFGDILIVSIPDEVYSECQLALRRSAGTLPVFVTTLTNGTNGYIAPREAFAAKSYATSMSPYAEGCFEQTITFLQTALNKLL